MCRRRRKRAPERTRWTRRTTQADVWGENPRRILIVTAGKQAKSSEQKVTLDLN